MPEIQSKNLGNIHGKPDEFLLKNGTERLSQLQHKHLANFAVSNQANSNSTSVKARIRVMKKFFSFLHLQDHIKVNIAKELSQHKSPKKKQGYN